MPKLDGFELHTKFKINTARQLKCIPYLFFSTAANQLSVIEAAYSISILGFFVNQNSFAELEKP